MVTLQPSDRSICNFCALSEARVHESACTADDRLHSCSLQEMHALHDVVLSAECVHSRSPVAPPASMFILEAAPRRTCLYNSNSIRMSSKNRAGVCEARRGPQETSIIVSRHFFSPVDDEAAVNDHIVPAC